MFCGSSSRCDWLVCSVGLWYFLIILTYFFRGGKFLKFYSSYITICIGKFNNYPHDFLKKQWGYIAIASVRPSGYLLLNHWTKPNIIWCVCCSHEWGVQRHIFLAPPPWSPGEGPKGQILLNIIKFQLYPYFTQALNDWPTN